VAIRPFLKRLRNEVREDNLPDIAAMMTYYAIFALFPMAVFVISLALLVVPADAIHQAVEMATRTMPRDVGMRVSQQVASMQQATAGGFAFASILLALYGASRGAVSLGRALNTVYDKRERRPWWKVQLTAIAVTIGVAILLVIAVGLLVAGPFLGHYIADRFGLGAAFDWGWRIGRWLGAALLVLLIWAIVYKFLPDTDAPLRVFTPGALAGTLLWLVMSQLFALYVSNFGKYEKTYGALGAVIIFLTWLWFSNLALLLGAEINDVIEDRKKARRGRVDRADRPAAEPTSFPERA
jgi:membrane protein